MVMNNYKYKPLPFEDYFTICSQNYNHIKTNLNLAWYTKITYKHKRHIHYVNFQVRYDFSRRCIQVIFQQTADKTDWRANFEFSQNLYDNIIFKGKLISLKVHKGWGDMYNACKHEVRRKIGLWLKYHPNSFIEVFGWSLGSGIAQIAAEDIYYNFKIKPYLYTFGSVKPFANKISWEYAKSCCQAAYNFYDHCDIVGYMVPWYKATNHIKLKSEKFNIFKLFNPWKYHTLYDKKGIYNKWL